MSNLHWILGLLVSSRALAFEGDGRNPGNWKMLPAAIETDSEGSALRLRNLDLFPKLCSLLVKREGKVVLEADRLLFRADRSLSLALGKAENGVTIQDLHIGMACVKVLASDDEPSLPAPKELACKPATSDCEQVCEAAPDQVNACRNDHLLVSFDRSSWTTTESSKEWTAEAHVSQQTAEPLTCQFLATAKIIGTTAEVSYLVNPSAVTLIEAGADQIIRWNFNKTEAGIGRELDLSRPRVVALCEVGEQKKPANWYFSCDPLKRSECNWLTQKN